MPSLSTTSRRLDSYSLHPFFSKTKILNLGLLIAAEMEPRTQAKNESGFLLPRRFPLQSLAPGGSFRLQASRPPALDGASQLLFAADIAGTLVFAVEGAMAAISGDLDILGVMVLAFATALGGGIIRDVLLGALPPASLRDWRYPSTVLGAGQPFSFCTTTFAPSR